LPTLGEHASYHFITNMAYIVSQIIVPMFGRDVTNSPNY